MGEQTTFNSYSAAVASGAVDAWRPETHTETTAYPTDPHPAVSRRSTDAAGATDEPQQYVTFGCVEYAPQE